MTYKVALVGCGWVGMGSQLDPVRIKPASHAQAIEENDNLEFTSIHDIDKKSKDLAKNLYPDVPFYDNIDELFQKSGRIDLVVIATNPDSHCFFIKKAIEFNVKNILVEKPISDNLKEAEDILELCKIKNVNLIVNHMRQFDPEINFVKEYVSGNYVKKNAIGKITNAIASYDNGLYHGGTHIIDLLISFLGPVKSVSSIHNTHFNNPDSNDLIIDAILEFDKCNAILYFVDSSKCSFGEINFIGEKGVLSLKNMWGMDIEITGLKNCLEYPIHNIPNYNESTKIGRSRSYFKSTYDSICQILKNPEKIKSFSLNSPTISLKVIEAISKSADKNGSKINI